MPLQSAAARRLISDGSDRSADQRPESDHVYPASHSQLINAFLQPPGRIPLEQRETSFSQIARTTMRLTGTFSGPRLTGLTGLWIGSTKSVRAKEGINRLFGLSSRTARKPSSFSGSYPADPLRLRTTIVLWVSSAAIASWSCLETFFPFGIPFWP